MSKMLLFVDDEPNVLQGLQRMLRPMRNEWQVVFARSGQEALAGLERLPFDVVVTDMQMPGMNGVQLLTEVRRRHPQVVRMVLSGHSDREGLLQLAGLAHQFLSKPCDAETVKRCVARACALRDLMREENLIRLISRLRSVPSLPLLYLELTQALQSDTVSLQKVGEIVSKDMAMSSKILQLVNSGFFGMPRRFSSPAEAVVLLGVEIVQSLVLSVHVFSEFPQEKLQPLGLETLWKHSMMTAAFAKRIAETEGMERPGAEAAFIAGFLHDIGKLVLAFNLPDQYQEARRLQSQKKWALWQAEREIFGTTHAEVAAYLLGLWGLPGEIVDSVAWHHRPQDYPGTGFGPLTAVAAANRLASESSSGPAAPAETDYFARLGVSERFPIWRSRCQQEK